MSAAYADETALKKLKHSSKRARIIDDDPQDFMRQNMASIVGL